MSNYINVHRRWYSMYWIETDHEYRCSLYVVYDRGNFGAWSYVFCNTSSYKNASKSIRLTLSMPCAIIPNVKCVGKARFWNIDDDGYGKILLNVLQRKNSKFANRTNWERTWFIMHKHGYASWLELPQIVPETIPDYEHIWGICDWDYGDTDPDGASLIVVDRKNNISIYSSSMHYNILQPDEEEESGLLVFDDFIRYRAKKVAKISIYTPEYLLWHPNSYACQKSVWRLNENEKKILINLLKKRNRNDKRKTNWEDLLYSLKRDGFMKYDRASKKYEIDENFISDLPMPDYMLLPEK